MHTFHYFHSFFPIQIWIKAFYLQESPLPCPVLTSLREYSYCVLSFTYPWTVRCSLFALCCFCGFCIHPSSYDLENFLFVSSFIFPMFVQRFVLTWATYCSLLLFIVCLFSSFELPCHFHVPVLYLCSLDTESHKRHTWATHHLLFSFWFHRA